jgi:deoxyribonuclease-2
MNIILSIFLVLNIIFYSTTAISCKDETNNDTPTWTIMKMPKGTDYYYYDINTGYNFSPFSLNDTNTGALSYTVKQLWNSNTDYIIYNDEPPNQPAYNFSVAHSKSILLWNNESGVIITHSIPEFPQGPSSTPYYKGLMQNAWDYGQAITCFTVSLSALQSTINMIIQMTPLIYDSHCKDCFCKNSVPSAECTIHTIDSKYILFIKPESYEVDIWASCIAPYFSSPIKVESWIHGDMDGAYCPPDYKFQTLDIQKLTFPGGQSFIEYDDHSKWGILNIPFVCFGDLNRVTTQKTRSGSVYCWKDSNLWNSLNKIITTTNTC